MNHFIHLVSMTIEVIQRRWIKRFICKGNKRAIKVNYVEFFMFLEFASLIGLLLYSIWSRLWLSRIKAVVV
jgi:hypothetical protein